jgi:hypothetical protein
LEERFQKIRRFDLLPAEPVAVRHEEHIERRVRFQRRHEAQSPGRRANSAPLTPWSLYACASATAHPRAVAKARAVAS